RNGDWTTKFAAWLIQQNALLRRFLGYRVWSEVAVVEPVVGIQRWVAVIPVNAAVIIIGAALRDELDLDRTFGRAFRARVRSRNCHLANGVCTGANVGKEPIVRFKQIVLNIDPVESDVQCAFRQAVYRRRAGTSRSRSAGERENEIQRIARCGGQVGNLTPGERSTDGSRLRLQQLAAAYDGHDLIGRADLEFDVDA